MFWNLKQQIKKKAEDEILVKDILKCNLDSIIILREYLSTNWIIQHIIIC